MARERVDVTVTVTVDKEDRDRLLAEGFQPIVRWVQGLSDIGLKTRDAVALIDSFGRAKSRVAKAKGG